MTITQTDKSFFGSFFSKKEPLSVLSVRNRILSSPAFQVWAARFPFTRPIARRRARQLFDLCAGFVYSQVLLAAVRLRLCEILLEGPQSLERLAVRLDLPKDAAHRLLEAAVSLRLAQRAGQGGYAAGDLGAALVGNPGVAAMVEHHGMLYADLRDPVALLRGEQPAGGTELGQHWPYAARRNPNDLAAADVSAYSSLMSASQPLVAADVLGAYRFDRHRCLLDVGGGEGTFLRAAARAAPRLKLMLFDLPAVAARAEVRFAEAGLGDRAQAIGGDFYHDRLPEGADIISLIRVIHDHDDAAALTILRAARQALPPGGTLLLAEPMAGTAGAEPVGAYFGFYLLAMGSGRPRRIEELTGMLQTAGFGDVRSLRTNQPLLVRVLVAQAKS